MGTKHEVNVGNCVLPSLAASCEDEVVGSTQLFVG